MRLDELQYDLPLERIAQHPAERRDASRLMVIDRATGQRRHETFARLPELLPPGTLLVLNDTRVLPARLTLCRKTGGRVVGLFLHEPEPGTWELMFTGSRRLSPGECLTLGPAQQLRLVASRGAGIWHAQPVPPGDAYAILTQYGRPPLPPYIKRYGDTETRGQGDKGTRRQGGEMADRFKGGEHEHEGERGREGEGERRHNGEVGGMGNECGTGETGGMGRRSCTQRSLPVAEDSSQSDFERYQTIYARQPGAIAAPTAGLHFTPQVFEALAAAGINTAFVTLHVGVGTFAPIRCEDLADHPMHAEWYECPEQTAAAVNAARTQGRKIVAVGTTSVRVLETCADDTGHLHAGTGWTRLFIYPPYRFKAVDVILTNFHLPGSTLLAMVFAFAGRDTILSAYEEAVRLEYRFYSYGDAMLIL